MKRLALLLSLLVSALSAPAAIPYEWPSDVDRPVPAVFEPFEGETVELACRVVRNRRDFPLYATNAVCYYQTNGMGRSYWSVPATVDGSLLRATLAPSDVPAAPVVYASIGAFGPSGIVYRANAILRYLPSPGAAPNVLPLPTPSIDFAAVAWTNAPWALASDVAALSTNCLTIAGGVVTGDVVKVSSSTTKSVSVVASGDLYYLENYDSPITVAFALSDVDAVAVGDAVSATYTLINGSTHETWTGAVSSAGADGVAVLFQNGVTVSGIAEDGDPTVSPETMSEGRMRTVFTGVKCAWTNVPAVSVSPFVTRAELVAATNALYQLLNH